MTKVSDLHEKWMKQQDYRQTHEALAPEFALANAVIEARTTFIANPPLTSPRGRSYIHFGPLPCRDRPCRNAYYASLLW